MPLVSATLLAQWKLSYRNFPLRPQKKRAEFTPKSEQGVLVKLFNLNLVDCTTASWPQILDFREDKKAQVAFARLRDFLFASCADMPIEQLQARLSTIIEDYELQSKKHGFETKAAAWDVLLNSQNLIKSMAAGGLGLLLSKGAAAAAIGIAAAPVVPAAVAASALAGTALAFDVGKAVIANKAQAYRSRGGVRSTSSKLGPS